MCSSDQISKIFDFSNFFRNFFVYKILFFAWSKVGRSIEITQPFLTLIAWMYNLKPQNMLYRIIKKKQKKIFWRIGENKLENWRKSIGGLIRRTHYIFRSDNWNLLAQTSMVHLRPTWFMLKRGKNVSILATFLLKLSNCSAVLFTSNM